MSPKLVEIIKRHEGYRKQAYVCTAGKLTVGYGRNLEDMGITQGEAEYLLLNDLSRCVEFLEKYPWYNSLDEVRKDVLVNMVFNLGEDGFLKFKKLIVAVYARDFRAAGKEMRNSSWYSQVKNRAKELTFMMETGQYV